MGFKSQEGGIHDCGWNYIWVRNCNYLRIFPLRSRNPWFLILCEDPGRKVGKRISPDIQGVKKSMVIQDFQYMSSFLSSPW